MTTINRFTSYVEEIYSLTAEGEKEEKRPLQVN